VRKGLVVAPILLVLAVATGSKFVDVRKDLLSQREAMDAQWEAVRNVLDQRSELAPELVDRVKAFMPNETGIYREIAESREALRTATAPKAALDANARLSYGLWNLIALSENSASLRKDATFSRLQDELAAIENSIAVERQKYNETLEHYNAQLQRFPDNVVAYFSGFGRNDAYFQTEMGVRNETKG
jgi:LemA protein